MIPKRSRGALAALLLSAATLCGCASVEFRRETPTSGTFESTAWAFTFLGFDFPSPALVVARGNASDSGVPNLEVTSESVVPRLGRFDWLLDILMIRRAHVSGTWGRRTP